MKIRFDVRHVSLDRRSHEQQRRADDLLEKLWRDRVANNPKEKARLARQRAKEIQ